MLNLAVVGLGTWGQRHLRSARDCGRFVVKLVVDPDRDRAEPVAREFGVSLLPTIEDVLSDNSVDAISLATPHSLHSRQIIQAAKSGKHVYTEKPFALNGVDAKRSALAAQKAGIQLALGHDQRHYPAIEKLKNLITESALGNILHVETNLSHNSIAMLYTEKKQQPDLKLDRSWRLESGEAPAGPISQFGIHRVDTLIHLFGKIDWVFSAGSSQAIGPGFIDTISVSLGFSSGVTGYIGNSLATPLSSRLQIYGTKKWAVCTGPETFADYRVCSLKDLVVFSEQERENHTFENIDSVTSNFSSFADAIEGVAPFIISVEEMVHTVYVIDAIQKSIKSGNKVTISY